MGHLNRTTVEDALAEVVAARRDLLDVLERLDPNDWDKDTLCQGWSVRDVASHVAEAPDLTMRKVAPRLFRSEGKVDKLIDEAARAGGRRDIEVILEHLRSNLDSRRVPPRTSALQMLTDVVIHSLDICYANGWDLPLPADRARMVLSTLVTLGGTVRGKQRAEGLRLETTDIDWRAGQGEHVRGPAAVMLLALAGRPVCTRLDGEGVQQLAGTA